MVVCIYSQTYLEQPVKGQSKWLLKTGSWFIQANLLLKLNISWQWPLKTGCLTEVTTDTGLTVYVLIDNTLCVCLRACVCAWVRACLRACELAYVRACVCVSFLFTNELCVRIPTLKFGVRLSWASIFELVHQWKEGCHKLTKLNTLWVVLKTVWTVRGMCVNRKTNHLAEYGNNILVSTPFPVQAYEYGLVHFLWKFQRVQTNTRRPVRKSCSVPQVLS